MRAWTIALLSLIAAAASVAGLARNLLPAGTPAEIGPVLAAHWPSLSIAAIAAYALAALLLTSAVLVIDMSRLRRRLARLAAQPHHGGRDLAEAFEPSRLRPLAARLGGPADNGSADVAIRPGELRAEIARLHYIWLIRTQFFTALALLVAFALIRGVQHYRPELAPPGDIPVVLTAIVLVGLVLLAGLSRLAIDTAGEPIVGAAARIPWHQPESPLTRRITDMLQATRSDIAAQARKPARPSSGELPDQLARVLDRSRRNSANAAASLSAAAEALRASTASMESTIESALARLSATGGENARGQAFTELQRAVERLSMQADLIVRGKAVLILAFLGSG